MGIPPWFIVVFVIATGAPLIAFGILFYVMWKEDAEQREELRRYLDRQRKGR